MVQQLKSIQFLKVTGENYFGNSTNLRTTEINRVKFEEKNLWLDWPQIPKFITCPLHGATAVSCLFMGSFAQLHGVMVSWCHHAQFGCDTKGFQGSFLDSNALKAWKLLQVFSRACHVQILPFLLCYLISFVIWTYFDIVWDSVRPEKQELKARGIMVCEVCKRPSCLQHLWYSQRYVCHFPGNIGHGHPWPVPWDP